MSFKSTAQEQAEKMEFVNNVVYTSDEEIIKHLRAENEQLRADLADAQQNQGAISNDSIIAELQNERNELTYKLARMEAERNVLREILFDLQEALFKLAYRDDAQQ